MHATGEPIDLPPGSQPAHHEKGTRDMNTPIIRGLVAISAILGIASGLTACSDTADNPPGEPKAAPSKATAGGDNQSASEGESSSTQVEPSMGDDFDGILTDVTTQACPTDKGEVKATGKVLNSKDDPRDILVSVVWLKKDSGDSVAINYVGLKSVPAGKAVKWSVPASLDRKAGRCVVSAKSNKVGTLS
ncbi:hypothetical protein NOCA2130015 [metagenome]|uniref:Uncharacterized protein n=1 Tax=metagenome TaxID=256318 RepID=A0A2P2BWQ7_9ZZZZ